MLIKFNEEQKGIMIAAINKYKPEKQKKKAVEELGELITAIAKEDRENIVEEIADVLIMIFQMIIIYSISKMEIVKWIVFKLKRLKERVRKEKELEEC